MAQADTSGPSVRDHGSMDSWGASLYGDPCRECGFDWSLTDDATLEQLSQYPSEVEAALSGATGGERHPDLTWSVGAYVCHVGDNLRIWSERVGGAVAGAGPDIDAYDQDLLADARNYDSIPLVTAKRSLRHSVAEYTATLAEASETGVLLVHPERGDLSRSDVLHANAHDALHHLWDIRRILEVALSA
jgi:hypothetical protein